jgi:hypothetical protein
MVGWDRALVLMSDEASNGSRASPERRDRPEGYVDEFDTGGDDIPVDREPHREDVRNLGSGSAVGLSCMVVVLALVALFWTVRGCAMR